MTDLYSLLWTTEDIAKRQLDIAKEKLREYYLKLSEDEKLIVQESLFMEFLGELENKVNAMIQSFNLTGINLEDGTFNNIANRCFKKIIDSKERQNTQPGEREFMQMFVKFVGNVLNDTYEIKKIYFHNNNEQWKEK